MPPTGSFLICDEVRSTAGAILPVTKYKKYIRKIIVFLFVKNIYLSCQETFGSLFHFAPGGRFPQGVA